jgi:hypothetical protein
MDGAEYAPVGNLGSTLCVRTDADAPRRQVSRFISTISKRVVNA